MITKKTVYDFWSSHPLGSYEIKAEPGSPEFFKGLEAIRDDSSGFVMDLYRFKEFAGKKVLDVGCGPGWISHKYAENNADIHPVDLTFTAVGLASKYFRRDGLKGKFTNADAEKLPFKNESFDFVYCDGVLHHTTEPEKGLAEIYRVLKKGHLARLSFYYENVLLKGWMFHITKLVMRLCGVRMHGVKKLPLSLSKEDFGKLYDGVDNPLGRIYTRKECIDMMTRAGFKVTLSKVYFFPKRFFPTINKIPRWAYRMVDGIFGTMIMFEVRKN